MDSQDASVLSFRAVIARVTAFAFLGLVAGLVLFAIESIDRVAVLRASFFSAGEIIHFVALLGPSILGAGIIGLALGLIATPLEVIRELFARGLARIRRLPAWLVDAVSLVLGASAVAYVLQLISSHYPDGLELSIHRLIQRIDDRLTPIPFVLNHWRGVYVALFFLLALAIMWAQLWIFRRKGRGSGWLAALVVAGAAAALAACYWFDSRAYFARYEFTIHYPLITGYTVLTILAAGFLCRIGSPMEWGSRIVRSVVIATLGLAIAGLGFTGYALAMMDHNQNVKAMIWNRSVIARRVYEAGKKLVDRDRDGYSPIFGGGDEDDGNPAVHPFSVEVAGNGVDDNCFGGDLALYEEVDRPKIPKPGEFVTVSAEPPAWDPNFKPVGVYDVDAPEAPKCTNGEQSSAGRKNVIIISIDCLRADHTSLFGYNRETTPNITRYAANGLAFANAIPHGTNTGHSFSAMLRSSSMEAIFDRNVPTLTQLLKLQGYHAAFINARRLDDWLPPRRWHRYRPTMIGDFDVLHLETEREWTADQLTDHTINYVDRLDANCPQFMWIHYMDVHMPREGHPEYGFGSSEVDVYDAEVKYTDAAVGRLLDHLKEKGILDNSIIFITADHGEGFLEHGTRDHSNKPYADNSHVPLVVLAPGVGSKTIATPVGLFDIAPTALSALGLPVPSVYRGIDLVGASAAPEFPNRPIVSETPRNGIETSFFAWAYIDWPFKFMYDIKGNTEELYDLSSDPNEQRNLVDRDRDRAEQLRKAFGRWLDLESTGSRPGSLGGR